MEQNHLDKPPMDKPPIPSPFETALAAPSQTGNYIQVLLLALACGALQWVLSGLAGVWLVAIVVLSFYFCCAILATLGVARAGKAMNWRVQREHLPQVRRVIDTNMKGAYIIMTSMWPFLLVSVGRGEPAWALPIMLFSIPFSIWSTGIEKRFKTMPAEEDVAQEYALLIAAWKEARFGLKK